MPTGTKALPGALTQEIAKLITAAKTITTTELARKTEISRPHLVKMLKGTKHWDIDQLEIICQALKLDLLKTLETAHSRVTLDLTSNVSTFPQPVSGPEYDDENIDLEGFDKAAHSEPLSTEPDSV